MITPKILRIIGFTVQILIIIITISLQLLNYIDIKTVIPSIFCALFFSLYMNEHAHTISTNKLVKNMMKSFDKIVEENKK